MAGRGSEEGKNPWGIRWWEGGGCVQVLEEVFDLEQLLVDGVKVLGFHGASSRAFEAREKEADLLDEGS